ncbi:MBL fold metallo-hydrolase [Erysipelotrichaceae bacterium HCN-30851]
MKFALLASGSKGNCCLIKHKDTNLVIDCGTTRKYLNNCFQQIQYDPMISNALLITHTHTDHVSQVKLFDPIPTFATQDINTNHLHSIRPFDTFEIQDFRITTLPMSHDCEGTVGYVIETENEKMVYVTDTGYIKEEVKEYIRNADYYIFESNHDIEMLMQTSRPIYLKQRIIGDNGHLCNEDSANILTDVMGQNTKEIILAHISQEGNTREMALDTLKQTLHKKQKDREGLKLHSAEQFGIYIGGK